MQEFDEVTFQRIKHEYPKNSHIVPGSTPVISFGDPSRARIVTIGINPSSVEFEGKGETLLSEQNRRLEDFQSLKISVSSEISEELARKIHTGCLNYFDRRPYHWFNQLDAKVNNLFDSSYRDRTAAHLDLVQWATKPVWNKIKEKNTQTALLNSDSRFLKHQLEKTSAKFVYLSGKLVFQQLQKTGIISAEIDKTFSFATKNGRQSSYSFYKGTTFNGLPVGGWSRVMPGHHLPRANMEEVFVNLSKFLKRFKV